MPRMTRFRRIFRGIVAAILLVALAFVAIAYLLALQSLPDYSGTRKLAGVAEPVQVIRDAHAVPHIVGTNDADVFFGLGYAHAQDRLWQMVLSRALVQGRLSERMGERSLRIDQQIRTLGLYRTAATNLQRLSDEGRRTLSAYAAGVNAYLEELSTHPRGRGAPELFLFGGPRIERWQEVDSLAMIKLMAYRLSGARQAEIRRARLAGRLPPERLRDLFPEDSTPEVSAAPGIPPISTPVAASASEPAPAAAPESPILPTPAPIPDPDPVEVPEPTPAAPEEYPSDLPGDPYGLVAGSGASNAWAASGARTATGQPLLATDPHLGLTAPAIWYLARLELEGIGGVIGATIPGLPAIVIGRNQHVGWGLTNAYLDDQDLYLEELQPGDATRYRTPWGWAPVETSEERFRIRGQREDTVLTRRHTRHGPVLPAELFDLTGVARAGHAVALRWTALDPVDQSFDAALGLMKARTIDEAIDALSLYGSPMQNVTLADRSEIAFQLSGRAPNRDPLHETQGRTPSTGWKAENDWMGYLPYRELPSIRNPASGIVANANNPTTDSPFPHHITHDWPAPYRFRRLDALLAERAFHSRQSFRAIQNDITSEMARTLLPLMGAGLFESATNGADTPSVRAIALDLLWRWNGEMDPNLAEPLIFVAWLGELSRSLRYASRIGIAAGGSGEWHRPEFVERILKGGPDTEIWCDNVSTVPTESCLDTARASLDRALATLQQGYGEDIRRWRWGRAHHASHRHTPLGYLGWIGRPFGVRHESGGGDHTIQRAQHGGGAGPAFDSVHGSGFRAIYDFAQLDRSEFIISTGQSGHFLSRHFRDQSAFWRDGGYLIMSLRLEDVRAGSVGTLTLSPADR